MVPIINCKSQQSSVYFLVIRVSWPSLSKLNLQLPFSYQLSFQLAMFIHYFTLHALGSKMEVNLAWLQQVSSSCHSEDWPRYKHERPFIACLRFHLILCLKLKILFCFEVKLIFNFPPVNFTELNFLKRLNHLSSQTLFVIARIELRSD